MPERGSPMSRENSHYRPYHHHKRRHYGGGGGRRIPDRWLNYDPVGRDLEGTPFVPFKTPLDKSFFVGKDDLSEDEHFDVDRIVQYAREQGKTIGLVVDLTNTDRYYKKTDWENYNVKYIKMNCPGHEVSEREDIVQKFLETVDEFVSDSSNDEKLIGVHCTHGLNRTGYLICRYLIDRKGWSAAQAISLFEYSRGHPIERGHYKKSLYEAEERIRNGTPTEEAPTENGGGDATTS
ncbi:hypothetical protein Y032_0032g2528 [Ancylostoma ceylanicum]|uniref:Uncharacterized protein n=1 Tax=Ancylostoma ceylanicum TaxID=53326 RepID=A0A016UNR4_9BILA|nr:hypothetical protein Y032_0032g2528 [Ancylostoma ceylanicum]